MATARAVQLKEEGNKCFQSNDFIGAEALYTKAINTDATNPLLYTNRAMARLKLHLYDAVIPDCHASLELLSYNMKAYYYLAQAEIELGQLQEAYKSAEIAYEMCSGIKTGVVDRGWERSLGSVTALVLRCKKELWERREDERLRIRNSLLEETIALMKAKKEDQVKKITALNGSQDDIRDAEMAWWEKEQEIRRVWDAAADKEGKRREVPDWIIDNITFAVMHDPVITKTGQSYERASITEHLRRSTTDPLTRESLLLSDLRPNLGLKAACSEFLEQNGWAVDW